MRWNISSFPGSSSPIDILIRSWRKSEMRNFLGRKGVNQRKDFCFRLKKVLEKKKKILAEEEADKKKRAIQAQILAQQSRGGKQVVVVEEGGNVLDEENDEDLLFR